MDSLIGLHLLAQHRHVVIRADQGVKGIDAVPGIATSVGTDACELAVDFLSCVHQNTSASV